MPHRQQCNMLSDAQSALDEHAWITNLPLRGLQALCDSGRGCMFMQGMLRVAGRRYCHLLTHSRVQVHCLKGIFR